MFGAILGIGSALLGYNASKKQAKAQNQAVAAQQAAEAQKAALANEQMRLADQLLHGQGYVPGQGVDSRPGQGGAMELSQDWTKKYLNWLQNSPDITYNAQRGAMEGNIRESMAMAARSLGQRGLSTRNVQSGAALKTMGGIGMQRAGLLASLEAGRHDRMGERMGMGAQFTQSLMDRALNLRSAATGTALNQQTMIPQMMAGQAAQYGQQAGAWGSLAGQLAGQYLFPSTVPMQQTPIPAAPTMAPVPNQFADFRMQPKGFGNVPSRRY